MDGIIIVDKEKNCTSRDVVNIASRVLKTKKVGHTGTLDPIATGVLVLCVNKATKVAELLTASDKEYIAKVELGYITDTLDSEGTIIKEEYKNISFEEINKVIKKFVKTYNQEVPIYSSVKVKGRKLYEYAREGIPIEPPEKEVTIYDLELLEYDGKFLTFRSKVSKGTYIRALIRDILNELGTIGTMVELRRISQGKFNVEEAISMESLKNGDFCLTSIRNFLDAKVVKLEDNISKKVLNGHPIELDYVGDYILFVKDDIDVAIYVFKDNGYKPFKVLNNS